MSTRLCAGGPNNNTALDLCDGIEVAPARSAQVRTQQNVTVNLVVAQMGPVTAAGRQAVDAGCQSARQRPGQPQSQLAAGSRHHGRRTPRLNRTHGVIGHCCVLLACHIVQHNQSIYSFIKHCKIAVNVQFRQVYEQGGSSGH